MFSTEVATRFLEWINHDGVRHNCDKTTSLTDFHRLRVLLFFSTVQDCRQSEPSRYYLMWVWMSHTSLPIVKSKHISTCIRLLYSESLSVLPHVICATGIAQCTFKNLKQSFFVIWISFFVTYHSYYSTSTSLSTNICAWQERRTCR